MTSPEASLEGLKKLRLRDYAVRFLFGGLVTASAAWVAQKCGPVVGGLLLAFPAILPAGLTLVKDHDGRAKAVDDARGGRLGAVALGVFALVVWRAARTWPPASTLLVAVVAWLAVAVAGWRLSYGRA
jgi:hypothetical protein